MTCLPSAGDRITIIKNSPYTDSRFTVPVSIRLRQELTLRQVPLYNNFLVYIFLDIKNYLIKIFIIMVLIIFKITLINWRKRRHMIYRFQKEWYIIKTKYY